MPEPTTVISDLASLPDRITAAAQHVEDLTVQLRTARQARDELIVEGSDHAGMKRAEVARRAGLSIPQVIRILGSSSEE